MQEGAWEHASDLLAELAPDYPDHPDLALLRTELGLRLDHAGVPRVRGRRTRLPWRRLVLLAANVVALAVIIWGASLVYRGIYVPRAQQKAQEASLVAARQDVQTSIAAGSYGGAVAKLDQLLLDYPDDGELQRLREDAKSLLDLEATYHAAVTAMEHGSWDEARTAFVAINAESPGFRDVPKRLQDIERQMQAQTLSVQAEASYQSHSWEEAQRLYTELRNLDLEYKPETVTAHLADALLQRALELTGTRPEEGGDAARAKDLLGHVLVLRVKDPKATAELAVTRDYLRAAAALAAEKNDDAIALLEAVYQARPSYLGGYAADQLFNAYLAKGDSLMVKGDQALAAQFYDKAARLTGPDATEARLRLSGAAVWLTPTMTPTPTPGPPKPTSTPEPPPKPLPLEYYKGWIAFNSNRPDGSGLWVMRPDGSGVRPLASSEAKKLEAIREKERTSPDGTTSLFAKGDKKNDIQRVNLFKLRKDLPVNWAERIVQLTSNPGQTYDGVWAPNNERIAYVSNTTGNDEIWTMNTDGGDQTQLTNNGWEWDKHPTWSPDGSKIAFLSNRSGTQQIWVMNADGTGLRNLSNNSYEEYDPIWLK